MNLKEALGDLWYDEILDTAIADQVRAFNFFGYETFASCAGHPWSNGDFPYLAFVKWDDALSKLAEKCGLEVVHYWPTENKSVRYEMVFYNKEAKTFYNDATSNFVIALNHILVELRKKQQKQDIFN